MNTELSWADAFPRAAQAAKRQNGSVAIDNVSTFASSDSQAMIDAGWFTPAYSGQVVTATTAMRVAAVYACVRLIAGSIASLPLPIYERTEGGRRQTIDHPLHWLLNEEPTPRFTAAAAWEYVVKSVLLRGDGFMRIVRSRQGVPIELVPLDPDKVIVERRGNRLVYFAQDNGEAFGVDQDDMLHFTGFGFDGLRSMSVIQWAAKQSIGIGMAAEEHSARFFSNGMAPSYVVTSTKAMKDDQIERLRLQLAEKASGTANAHKPLVFTEGMDAKPMSLSATDGQLLETRKYQVIDIARAFGVPAFMIGESEKTSSWGTGVGQLTLGFVKFTLTPPLTNWEQELKRKLFRMAKYFTAFDLSGLLRGDDKARSDYFRQALGGAQGPGWMTPNQVRDAEFLLPEKDPLADKIYIPSQGTLNANPPKAAPAGE